MTDGRDNSPKHIPAKASIIIMMLGLSSLGLTASKLPEMKHSRHDIVLHLVSDYDLTSR